VKRAGLTQDLPNCHTGQRERRLLSLRGLHGTEHLGQEVRSHPQPSGVDLMPDAGPDVPFDRNVSRS